MEFLQEFYRASFFIAASVVCVSTLVFHRLEITARKAHNRVYSLLVFITLLSALTSMTVVFMERSVYSDETAALISDTAQYIYFIVHSLLPVIFYLYVAMVSGVIYAHGPLKQAAALVPCAAMELLVLINPVFHFVYYYGEGHVFIRGWGEWVVYGVSAFYLILAMAHLLIYWSMFNFRRRWALLYSFGIAIAGIVLQLISIKLLVELLFESMAFAGIMMTVEKEDDRVDTATGVYNRSAMTVDISNYLRLKTHVFLLCVRVTNSDILQRITGSSDSDSLLKDIATYLKEVHQPSDIYRAQSSTFLLVCRSMDADRTRELAFEITRRFDRPWAGQGTDVRLKAVLMIAEMPDEYRTLEDVLLLTDCDIPLSESRRILAGEELRFIKREAQVEEALINGFAERSFEIYYQPVYNLRSKAIYAAEATLVLHDTKLGVVYSEEFLPIAARSDILDRLNALIIEEICLFLSTGIPTEMGLMRILVSVSAYQCLNPSFTEDLKRNIRKYGINASLINFELREFVLAGDYPRLKRVIGDIKEMGFHLSLDRFGMGDSNLQTLSELNFDVVNMDLSVLTESAVGRDDEIGYLIVENSVRMISQMHRQILVKGITTQEQIDRLSELDVDYLQGDYYSRPVTQNELISILRVTEVARREEQQARAKSEAKSSFLANMSHEIRTPINAILGMNEMILRESGDESIISYARDIERAGNTLLSLINDILDFSKIEAGSMEIVLVEYGLSSVINDVANLIQVKVAQKQLEFKLDVDETLPETLYGDEMRIRQIIVNLLNNAVKYTESGSVTLSVHGKYLDEDSIMLRVDVTDTGMGIKEEDIDKLFGTFQRVDVDRNRTIEGTGLGLAITQNLLSLMSGDIEVKSEYGKGSTFSVRLPQMVLDRKPIGDLKERFKLNALSRSEYRESFRAPDARILVVDDTPMNLTVVKGLLKQTQIQIDTVLSGRECLEVTAKTRYDCIFLDYRMPELDGTATLKLMREQKGSPNEGTPVIVLTANALSGARERFLMEGFDDYLTKPVETRKLEQALMKYLPPEKIEVTQIKEPDKADGEGTADGELTSDPLLTRLLRALPDIDMAAGFERCGGEEGYREALEIYKKSLPAKAKDIRRFYEAGDWANYTIQVHSLKSTSRVIGAMELGEEAWAMEQAGDKEDEISIVEGTPGLLNRMEALSAALDEVWGEDSAQGDTGAENREEIDEVTLKEAYQTLKDFVSQMDFEDSSFVIEELKGYALSEADKKRTDELKEALEGLDWEKMSAIIDAVLVGGEA